MFECSEVGTIAVSLPKLNLYMYIPVKGLFLENYVVQLSTCKVVSYILILWCFLRAFLVTRFCDKANLFWPSI